MIGKRIIIKAVGRGKQGSGDARTFRPPRQLRGVPNDRVLAEYLFRTGQYPQPNWDETSKVRPVGGFKPRPEKTDT